MKRRGARAGMRQLPIASVEPSPRSAAARIEPLRHQLHAHAEARQAQIYLRFFKTGPGQYGEGDRFLGVRVPTIRALTKQGAMCSVVDLVKLLRSPWHEERMLALLSLVSRYRRADDDERSGIYRAYLANTRYINNWDLIDSTAEHIVGAWLAERDRRPLATLARSKSVWERRIAIMATFHYIKRGEPDETLQLARQLIDDGHDLIHKAVGWMLREVGKRCDRMKLCAFLDEHAARMPRTMLRYAIEHLTAAERHRYLRAGGARSRASRG